MWKNLFQSQTDENNTCVYCGRLFRDSDKFCTGCGATIEQQKEAILDRKVKDLYFIYAIWVLVSAFLLLTINSMKHSGSFIPSEVFLVPLVFAAWVYSIFLHLDNMVQVSEFESIKIISWLTGLTFAFFLLVFLFWIVL